MASSSHQQGNNHLKFTNSPCFFKIILQDTINNGKLGIPRKFVKEHGHSMSRPSMLRVPSGEVREVELTKCEGKIWFGKGWLQFASHYSVDMGHLLVFRYDGNSNFHVTIFDRSATEMQYTHTSNQPSEEIPEHIINNSEDVDSLHILHNESPSRKVREKSQSPSPRPHKMMRSTNSAITTETECNENNALLPQQGCAARKDDKSMSHDTIRTKEHESNEAFERARNTFQSENPFFLVVVHPSYVFRLALPTNFVREHLMKEHCCITLCNSSGKTWVVTYKQKYTRKRLLSHLRNGWGTFVHANNIKVGDVCAFELINSIKLSFKVHIYKGQHANCHQPLTSTHVLRPVKRKPPSNASPGCREKPQSPCLWSHRILRSSNTTIETEFNKQSGCAAQSVRYNEKVKAVERDGNSFKSENQSFLIVMQPTHVGQNHSKVYRLVLPCNFAKKYLMKEHCFVTLCSSGKTWIANIKQEHIANRLHPYIQSGWGTFVRDNSIQLGDVCSFELINSIQLSFKVVIRKGQHEKNCHQSASTEVILLILNGKSWPVRLYQHGVSIERPKPNVVFSEGWRRFSVDNNLEVGDVCRFELTKGAETSMNVTITKK